jgi:hypothetical protein
MHPLAGGVFPFPPTVSDLVKRLAPPNTFEVSRLIKIIITNEFKFFKFYWIKKGPFVMVDDLLKIFKEVEIREGMAKIKI